MESEKTESEKLRVQTGNHILLGGLSLMACVYLAWVALEDKDLAIAACALLAAIVFGFSAAFIAQSESCTISVETMEVCKELLEACKDDLQDTKDLLDDQAPRIVKYI